MWPGDDVAIAAVLVAELGTGVELTSASRRAAREAFSEQVLRLIPVVAVAQVHGSLLAVVQHDGAQRGAHDLIIATAGGAHRGHPRPRHPLRRPPGRRLPRAQLRIDRHSRSGPDCRAPCERVRSSSDAVCGPTPAWSWLPTHQRGAKHRRRGRDPGARSAAARWPARPGADGYRRLRTAVTLRRRWRPDWLPVVTS